MKAPAFAYARARDLAEVFDLLERHGEHAKLLAGGQSLLASLNLRLSRPSILVDINGVHGLAEIRETDAALVIGAMARHVALEHSPVIARHAPLIARAMPHIGHPAIRNRGTIGGSLAFADPAAELPACAVALGATLILRSRSGERRVAAADFFRGLFETDLRPGEILAAVEIPKAGSGHRHAFLELARRHGDYAMVGLAAAGDLRNGRFASLKLVYFGIGDRPVAAAGAAARLASSGMAGVDAACAALDGELDPAGDLNGGPDTKRHLAAVLLRRAAPALFASA